MSEQTWVIQTEDLQDGTILSFDLLDSAGNVLHKAGMPINERLKSRLAASGIKSVTIRGSSDATPEKVEAILADSYNPAVLESLNSSLSLVQSAIGNMVLGLSRGEEVSAEDAKEGVISFVDGARKDVAAALSVLVTYHPNANSQHIDRIAERSSKLSLLGVTTALVQGQSEEFAMEVGLAGLLHDCSLVLHPELLERAPADIPVISHHEAYVRHPLDSAEMLSGSDGISQRVIETITQVHEQADGSGYPRGLRLNQTLYQAVILNAADAYLALTDNSARRRFIQSDAMAYLINHAAKGRFCPKTIQAMLRGMSIYPIGTVVMLDDNTKAVVIKANQESPMQPVVRSLSKTQQRIDLFQTRRNIQGPFADGTTGFQRIRKSELNEVFWRTDQHMLEIN